MRREKVWSQRNLAKSWFKWECCDSMPGSWMHRIVDAMSQFDVMFNTLQDRMAILVGILPIFNSFPANFLPTVPYPAFFCPHVYRFCLFLPVSTYFLPKMVPHPCYKLKHSTPSAVFPPTCLRILPIFCLCSAHFLPNLPLIFRWSYLAG